MSDLKSSWKTTVGGLAAAIGTAVAAIPDTPSWLHLTGAVIAAAGLAVLGLAARDNNLSSEQVGAGNTGKVDPPKA